jgi:RND superfamily putative drug exporter
MTIGAAFGVAMMALFFIGSILNVFYITEMFLLVSMMGAGCDYCIFILARYREERMSGKEHKAAVREAIMWAGESISTSGLAVIIGFGAMSICSFSMISTMGIMLAVGVLIALMAALTLITSILALVGDKLFWPSRPDKFKDGGEAVRGWYGKVSRFGRSYFVKSAKFSIKYAKPILVVAVLFTVPMAYITFTSPSSYDMVGGMSAGEAADGLKEVEKYSNGGMMAPSYIVLELNNPLATIETFDVPVAEGDTVKMGIVNWSNPSELTKLEEFRQSLSGDDNVGDAWGIFIWVQLAEAAAIDNPKPPTMSDHDYALLIYSKVLEDLPIPVAEGISGVIPLVVNYVESQKGQPVTYNDTTVGAVMDYLVDYVGVTSIGGTGTKDASGNDLITVSYVKFTVVTKEESMSDRSMKTIGFLDSKMSDFAKNSGIVTKSWLTGSAAIMFEISEQVNSEFDKVEILAILLIFILLFFVMKSYITPLRSILTILMSVAWTIAITHLLFSELLGFGVLWIIPIILLVICLGLGMDYDILLTTRIKENVRHKGMSNDEAITAAVTHSGSVITICGLIMGGAFGTLMLSGTVMLQEFGFALCFAIIVDALLVRTYIVPAAMHLLGDWNWKGPKFLQKAK